MTPMDREPVAIILAGLAAVLSSLLVATNALGWTHLDAGQIAAIIAAVASFCALIAAAIRGQVYSRSTHAEDVVHALMRTPPDPELTDGGAPLLEDDEGD